MSSNIGYIFCALFLVIGSSLSTPIQTEAQNKSPPEMSIEKAVSYNGPENDDGSEGWEPIVMNLLSKNSYFPQKSKENGSPSTTEKPSNSQTEKSAEKDDKEELPVASSLSYSSAWNPLTSNGISNSHSSIYSHPIYFPAPSMYGYPVNNYIAPSPQLNYYQPHAAHALQIETPKEYEGEKGKNVNYYQPPSAQVQFPQIEAAKEYEGEKGKNYYQPPSAHVQLSEIEPAKEYEGEKGKVEEEGERGVIYNVPVKSIEYVAPVKTEVGAQPSISHYNYGGKLGGDVRSYAQNYPPSYPVSNYGVSRPVGASYQVEQVPKKEIVKHVHNEHQKVVHRHNHHQKVLHEHNLHRYIVHNYHLHRFHIHNYHKHKEHINVHKNHVHEKHENKVTNEHRVKETGGEAHKHVTEHRESHRHNKPIYPVVRPSWSIWG